MVWGVVQLKNKLSSFFVYEVDCFRLTPTGTITSCHSNEIWFLIERGKKINLLGNYAARSLASSGPGFFLIYIVCSRVCEC